jgi:hypothetical protein
VHAPAHPGLALRLVPSVLGDGTVLLDDDDEPGVSLSDF